MTWDDVLTRMENAGLNPVEETYMENYGKILSAQRPEFQGRNFRCTYGAVKCGGIDVELFLFPNDVHRDEFLDVIGNDPWWLVRDNVVVHFPEIDPAVVTRIMDAIAVDFRQ